METGSPPRAGTNGTGALWIEAQARPRRFDPNMSIQDSEKNSGVAAHDAIEDAEDFGKALEAWESGFKSLKEGDVVSGRVLKILEKEVVVDIGFKSEGVIDINEVKGYDGALTVKVGDRIEVLL